MIASVDWGIFIGYASGIVVGGFVTYYFGPKRRERDSQQTPSHNLDDLIERRAREIMRIEGEAAARQIEEKIMERCRQRVFAEMKHRQLR